MRIPLHVEDVDFEDNEVASDFLIDRFIIYGLVILISGITYLWHASGTVIDTGVSTMFVDKMLNQSNAPLLEQMVKFTEARQRVLAENIVNASTPGYIQKDLSMAGFQQMLRERIAKRAESAPGTVRFDDITAEIENPRRGILYHDGNNRSMEQLMTDQAKNGLMHNMFVELLRKSYGSIESALKERVG